MALLNTADALHLGTQPVERVYLGSNEVWSALPPFDPVSLFKNGEIGSVIDPSDFSTMFQDSAGTIPVTAVGQPVGRIVAKAGGGSFIQATTTQRPIIREGAGLYYLDFDGVDDGMVVQGLPSSFGTALTAAVGVLHETYVPGRTTGAYLGYYIGGARSVFWAIRWSGGTESVRFYNIEREIHAPSAFGVPHAYLMKAESTGGRGIIEARVDGAYAGWASDAYSATYGVSNIRLMSHNFAGGAVDGRIYGAVFINRVLDEVECNGLDRWIAKKAGVTLS